MSSEAGEDVSGNEEIFAPNGCLFQRQTLICIFLPYKSQPEQPEVYKTELLRGCRRGVKNGR